MLTWTYFKLKANSLKLRNVKYFFKSWLRILTKCCQAQADTISSVSFFNYKIFLSHLRTHFIFFVVDIIPLILLRHKTLWSCNNYMLKRFWPWTHNVLKPSEAKQVVIQVWQISLWMYHHLCRIYFSQNHAQKQKYIFFIGDVFVKITYLIWLAKLLPNLNLIQTSSSVLNTKEYFTRSCKRFDRQIVDFLILAKDSVVFVVDTNFGQHRFSSFAIMF